MIVQQSLVWYHGALSLSPIQRYKRQQGTTRLSNQKSTIFTPDHMTRRYMHHTANTSPRRVQGVNTCADRCSPARSCRTCDAQVTEYPPTTRRHFPVWPRVPVSPCKTVYPAHQGHPYAGSSSSTWISCAYLLRAACGPPSSPTPHSKPPLLPSFCAPPAPTLPAATFCRSALQPSDCAGSHARVPGFDSCGAAPGFGRGSRPCVTAGPGVCQHG